MGLTLIFIAPRGNTPLMSIATKASPKTLKKLLSSGANSNLINSEKDTALILACVNKQCENAKILIEYGADVNMANHGNSHALAYVIRHSKNLEFVKYLIQKGSRLDIISNDTLYYGCDRDSSLLHFCALGINQKTSSYQILSYLLSLGKIDTNQKNGEIKRYIDYLV